MGFKDFLFSPQTGWVVLGLFVAGLYGFAVRMTHRNDRKGRPPRARTGEFTRVGAANGSERRPTAEMRPLTDTGRRSTTEQRPVAEAGRRPTAELRTVPAPGRLSTSEQRHLSSMGQRPEAAPTAEASRRPTTQPLPPVPPRRPGKP
jgi:hypothetical protein